MAITITNVASTRAQRYLANATSQMNTAMERLASGLRINSAKDDPAGLQISNRMTSEINGLYQANRNASDGIALMQTYEGALDEVVNMLQKIRTIAVQASNGTYTSEDRAAMQAEVDQLSEEITRIAEQTKYGGETILLGEDSSMFVNGTLTLQVGAYQGDTIEVDLTQSFRLQDIYDGAGLTTGIVDNDGHFTMSTQEEAQQVLGGIDQMIGVVNSARATSGAMQTRLESVIRVGQNNIVNLSDARSRIRDTDYAEETANYIRSSIVQQTSLAMLMQANAQPNIILQLINASII